MSLFRRTFSRKDPDRLLEISERIYVFDSCLSNTDMSENDCKSYLGGVVMNLQKVHPGASFMVFNFREGDQTSLLSDILIDYDMAVVDYPQHYEGYPMLPLEMIHYFLRSSDSWLSLEGHKNVILMNCGKGGWPVLAFMLAGLLLFRKQYTGEQKTLEMVYKQAPKEILSVVSRINPRASQLRYLQYITGRDLASVWPPSDAPVIMDYLLLRNLPLFDNTKGCRPVVRVYGTDPSAKGNRNPRLLFSTLMAEEPVWLYSKEECVFVKLEIRCQVQGDAFLECIHLCDDLASEEMIFKVMFHSGFIQSNILALNSDEIDIPSQTKYNLPNDFKAEVLFRDINEAPQHITVELGSGEEDSDSEFFEVEDNFTSMSETQERKADLGAIIPQQDSITEDKSQERKADFSCSMPREGNIQEENLISMSTESQERKANLGSTISLETKLLEKNFIPMSGSQESGADIGSTIAQEANIPKENFIPMFDSKERELDSSITTPQEANILGNIFTPMSESQERKADFSSIIPEEANTLDRKSKDCTLHNGSPRWDLESEVNYHSSVKDIAIDEGNLKQASGIRPDIEDIEVTDVSSFEERTLDEGRQNQVTEAKTENNKQAPAVEPCMNTMDVLVLEDRNHKQASERDSDISAAAIEAGSDMSALKNILEVDGRNRKQISVEESEISASARGTHSVMNALKNIHKIASEESGISASIIEAETGIITSKNIYVVDDRSNKQASDKESVISASTIGAESSNSNVVIGSTRKKKPSETKSDINASKNIMVVDDGSQMQQVKVKTEPKPVPNSTKSKQNKKNKWQEITTKTIKQQRVVSQWVPRTKPPAPEPTKPKPVAYKWVPKGTDTPTDGQ